MRLSKNNAQKLTQMVWRERLRKIAFAVAALAAVVFAAVEINSYQAARSDPTVEVHTINATVSRKDTTRAGRSGFIFHAHLADGRDVDALSPAGMAIADGSAVILAEARHKSGRLSFELIRVVE